jgi:hypothetical protein
MWDLDPVELPHVSQLRANVGHQASSRGMPSAKIATDTNHGALGPIGELLISPAPTAFQVVNVDMLARCDLTRGDADHLAVLDDRIASLD